MLTFFGNDKTRDCSGHTRRHFLRVGALGLGGLSLPWLLQRKAEAAESDFVRDKSVVFLFLNGGPSQLETWDPKPEAPVEFRQMFGEVPTSLPGVAIGATFPKLARMAKKLALVRSFQSGTGSHGGGTNRVLSGGTRNQGAGERGASIGSIYSRLRGPNHPLTGMPTFTQLIDQDPETAYANGKKRMIAGNSPGFLGAAYAAFDPSQKGQLSENMRVKLPAERFQDRRALLDALDGVSRRISAGGELDAYRRQAFDLILGDAREAFDLSKEDPRVVEKYDTSRFIIGHRSSHPCPLGHHLLLARRLCEAGCGFITINTPQWDMHEGGNNPGIHKGISMMSPPVDHAVSTFLEDLEERGLSDKIMLVVTGEMGRTPRINKKGGRDHWGDLTSLLLAGGGWSMGQVVGQSDNRAGRPVTEPIRPENLLATIMHTLFDVGQLRVQRGLPRELLSLVEDHAPIRELA